MLAEPERWASRYGSRPTFGMTSRELPRPAGADVRFGQGAGAGHPEEIRAAAAGSDVCIVGGDLAGEFFDAASLDEVVLTVAPVFFAAGAPLLPRRIGLDWLTLRDVTRRGQFADLR